MEPEQPQNTKTISVAIAVLLILAALGAGYIWSTKYRVSNDQESLSAFGAGGELAIVVVRNTPLVGGILPLPEGFPQDIPLESGEITESATTNYPGESVRQLSVSYQSSKTITEKYAEYRNYMTTSGYQITEESANSPTRTILGAKGSADLSVVISSAGGRTLVQISYLKPR